MLSVLIFAFVLFIVLLLMILCSVGASTNTDTNYYGSGDGGKLEAHDIYHTTGESRF